MASALAIGFGIATTAFLVGETIVIDLDKNGELIDCL
jgi:uncharacterized protein YuzE